MADLTAASGAPGRARQEFRPDRVYLGWQYRPLAPDPGPPPRRPTPPEQEQLNPEWVAAQRREENLLNRPLKAACGIGLALAAAVVAGWLSGVLAAMPAALGIIACLAGAAAAGHALWQREQALRSRVAGERQRLATIRAAQESRLFAWQEEHKRRFEAWQQHRTAYDRQRQWYAVSLPEAVDRLDVAGGTLAGWSALSTMIGASRLSAGGELTVIDLSEGAAAADLVAVAQRSGMDPLVWLLPVDLPRLDIGTGLAAAELADVLSLVVSVSEEHAATRDLSYDNAILERVLATFPRPATIAEVTAALRALAQVGDPRDDVKLGLISADQLERLAALFGRGAADRIVIERAWAMESQLRKLENLATAPARVAPAPLRVVSTDRRAGVFGNRVLGTFVVTALTHMLRQAPAGRPWQHTVFLLGAEKLRGDVLDRLCDACEHTRTGLVLAYRSIPAHVKERLGRGNSAVAFMRLGNADDASAASEQIGTEHRFVLSQLTETVGTDITDTAGGSYTSTAGTSDAVSASTSQTETEGRSRGKGTSRESPLAPFGRSARSRSSDASRSYATSGSETLTAGITTSTAWGVNTTRAAGTSQSLARSSQRSREVLVEPHELQQLPPSAMIVSYAAAGSRHVVLADANPAIVALPTATLLSPGEAPPAPPPQRTPTRPAEQHPWPGPGSPAPGGTAAGARGAAASAAAAGAGGAPGVWPGGGQGVWPGGGHGPWPEEAPEGEAVPRPGGGHGATPPARAGEPPGGGPGGPAETPERTGRPGAPVSWRGDEQPPPNLGPPPPRLDWRTKKPRDGS